MADRVQKTCENCTSFALFEKSDDGFYYCNNCNSQADDIFDTGIDQEQFLTQYNTPGCYRPRPTTAHAPLVVEPLSQVKFTSSQYLDTQPPIIDDVDTMYDEDGPTEPRDFGSRHKTFTYEEYYSQIRSRYLTGLQVMIQLQCQALVEEFNVSPLIVGLIGPLWLRFLASSRVMADEWAQKAVHDSEAAQIQGDDEEFRVRSQYRSEPVNIHGKRVVYVWYKSLSNVIPISSSLAISVLVCLVAREAILPSDILNWSLEGKLPYLAAFDKIKKQLGPRSGACPISDSRMFRPLRNISSQKLESMAAEIAQKIGLQLPPVNFYAIASRYCTKLSLPTQEIIPFACRVCEWSMPSELYLSANEFRIPTRACVMSILIVTVRILFNINGYGMWESSLSNPNCSKSSSSKNTQSGGAEKDVEHSRMSVEELLRILEAKYNEHDNGHAYAKDLDSYLQYCKDVVFSGLQSSIEDLEEEKLIEEFWEFYQNNKVLGSNCSDHLMEVNETTDDQTACGTSQNHDQDSTRRSGPSTESPKDEAIRKLKLDMEENKFSYIPPRVKVKRKDYLHYARRRKDVLIYAVHADYYVLLRICAKIAQVETRIMHVAVLCFERRLNWLEKRVDYSLDAEPDSNDVCDNCKCESVQTPGEDPMDLNI